MTQVTDHAVLRHLERTYGVDVEHYRRELDTPAVAKAVEIGCGCVVGHRGERLMIREGKVMTVVTKRMGRRPRAAVNIESGAD